MTLDHLKIELPKVKSVKSLMKLGNIEDISREIREIMSPIDVKIESYQDAYDAIGVLKKKWVPWQPGPFLSKTSELCFVLTEMDGKKRNKYLGITEDMYRDKKKASKWYKDIAKYVHPDLIGGDEKPFIALKEVYNIIVDYEDK